MKGLTLTQPWATLVAFQEKQIETRSWSTDYRGLLAIHAAKGVSSIGGEAGLSNLCESDPFFSVLRRHVSGYTAKERAADLPRGVIVAVVELVDVVPTSALKGDDASVVISEKERAFGDYSPSRFAWVLRHRLNLYDGVPCRGALGLWNVPSDVVAQLEIKEDAQ